MLLFGAGREGRIVPFVVVEWVGRAILDWEAPPKPECKISLRPLNPPRSFLVYSLWWKSFEGYLGFGSSLARCLCLALISGWSLSIPPNAAPHAGAVCTPDRPPRMLGSLASEVGKAVLSRTICYLSIAVGWLSALNVLTAAI